MLAESLTHDPADIGGYQNEDWVVLASVSKEKLRTLALNMAFGEFHNKMWELVDLAEKQLQFNRHGQEQGQDPTRMAKLIKSLNHWVEREKCREC